MAEQFCYNCSKLLPSHQFYNAIAGKTTANCLPCLEERRNNSKLKRAAAKHKENTMAASKEAERFSMERKGPQMTFSKTTDMEPNNQRNSSDGYNLNELIAYLVRDKIKESAQKQTSESEAFHSTQSKMPRLEQNHKSHSCPECYKSFSRIGHLGIHMETHKPKHERTQFPCRLKCGLICLYASSEADHFKRVHLHGHTKKIRYGGYFKCAHCQRWLKTNYALDQHISKKHPEFWVRKGKKRNAESGSTSTASLENVESGKN